MEQISLEFFLSGVSNNSKTKCKNEFYKINLVKNLEESSKKRKLCYGPQNLREMPYRVGVLLTFDISLCLTPTLARGEVGVLIGWCIIFIGGRLPMERNRNRLMIMVIMSVLLLTI